MMDSDRVESIKQEYLDFIESKVGIKEDMKKILNSDPQERMRTANQIVNSWLQECREAFTDVPRGITCIAGFQIKIHVLQEVQKTLPAPTIH